MNPPPAAPMKVKDRSPAGRGLVRRPDLFRRLSAAEPGGVILLCAPAGSGKSVLVHSWVETEGLDDRVARVSVERGERDPQRFWLSVIDAFAALDSADGAIERVAPSPSFRGKSIVGRLLSELGSVEGPMLLVIDDLHELHSTEALRWLELFLTRLPAQLRVVLATREEPGLGLHLLRLSGLLTELRGPDLRFSLSDTKRFLEASGILLPEASVALLHERTEGWAAGLRLAAISLTGHPHPERLVAEFSGSERTVGGYLLAEVLNRQPPKVRHLLLCTAVLERVNGALADELTGTTGSEAILQGLEEANAFVVSLDVGRNWFRYHHLLADMLRLELRRTSPDLIHSLHRVAAEWFDEHRFPVEAIRHAQAAQEWRHATHLLADNYVDLVFDGRKATLRALLASFPPNASEENAELAVVFATARLYDGLFEESGMHIAVAERLAAKLPEERKRLFNMRLASAELWLACQRGDLGAAKEAIWSFQARTADELSHSNDHRVSALLNLGIAELWSLHLHDARRDLEQALALARRIDRPYLEVGCLGHLALAATLGLSPPAVGLRLSEEAKRIADAHGWGTHRIMAPAVLAAAGALAWLGRFEEAEGWLGFVEDEGPGGEELDSEPAPHQARAFLRLGQGRPEEALEDFRAAERIQAARAQHHILTNDLRGWIVLTQALMGDMEAARIALDAADDEEREGAGMRLAAAALELAEGDSQRALDVLAPMIVGSPRALHPRWASVHALLFEAAARDRLADREGAEASIEQALELAEADGIILPFTLAPVSELLERHPRDSTRHGALLSSILDVLSGVSLQGRGEKAILREELSEAELRIMRYLPSNLKAPEIASELFVSANTVRTHLRHIYAKLDAHSRSEAVARARELGLLAPALRTGAREAKYGR